MFRFIEYEIILFLMSWVYMSKILAKSFSCDLYEILDTMMLFFFFVRFVFQNDNSFWLKGQVVLSKTIVWIRKKECSFFDCGVHGTQSRCTGGRGAVYTAPQSAAVCLTNLIHRIA